MFSDNLMEITFIAFYHQSFKVFGARAQIEQAKELFERLANGVKQ
jgi:hypothetical protein